MLEMVLKSVSVLTGRRWSYTNYCQVSFFPFVTPRFFIFTVNNIECIFNV